jgi:hypothetical protein
MKLAIPLALILTLGALGVFRRVPLWACVFVGMGIQSAFSAAIEFTVAFIASAVKVKPYEYAESGDWEISTTPLDTEAEDDAEVKP